MKHGDRFYLSHVDSDGRRWWRDDSGCQGDHWASRGPRSTFTWIDQKGKPLTYGCTHGTKLELTVLAVSENITLELHDLKQAKVLECVYPNWRSRFRLWRAGLLKFITPEGT